MIGFKGGEAPLASTPVMTLDAIEPMLARAWCAESSADAAWGHDKPSLGQCAVTALVVQDIFGGDLLWAEVQLPGGARSSHYWNRIDGVEVDLTRDQFPEGSLIPPGEPKPGAFASTRLRVLSFEATCRRYRILLDRLTRIRGPEARLHA